jgi:NADH-quinone oxidoreductase subunit C/D
MLYGVVDVWPSADLNEREVYDFFGIRFIGHPDMRRIFLREDWEGFPLRKDYDVSPEANPVPQTNEQNADTTISLQVQPDGSIKEEERVIFSPEDYVVNIGPQHPSTHGVMRLRCAIDGETINKVIPVCGYIHRGIERLCESKSYPQTLFFTDSMDYMSSCQNRHCLCLCIEKALGIEVPHRVQVIRVMMDELMRLSSHLLSFGCMAMDMGATTAFVYGFREREQILDILEKTTGGRMSQHYHVIGGVAADVHPEFIKDVRELCAIMPERVAEYHKLFTGNIITEKRTIGVGVVSKEDVISYATTGPNGRASGWACDVRKRTPYAVYDELKFDEIVYTEGDSFARYMVRMDEVVQCVKMLEQLCDMLEKEEGNEIAAPKVPKMIKLPAGRWFQEVEASRGSFGVYIESDGGKNPYRMHFNSPCLNHVGAIDAYCANYKIADLITISASMDYVIPDIDR